MGKGVGWSRATARVNPGPGCAAVGWLLRRIPDVIGDIGEELAPWSPYAKATVDAPISRRAVWSVDDDSYMEGYTLWNGGNLVWEPAADIPVHTWETAIEHDPQQTVYQTVFQDLAFQYNKSYVPYISIDTTVRGEVVYGDVSATADWWYHLSEGNFTPLIEYDGIELIRVIIRQAPGKYWTGSPDPNLCTYVE